MTLQSGSVAEMVAALVLGRPLAEAARAGGMSVSTVQRRLRDPEIAELIAEARAEMAREAIGRIRSLRSKALVKLEALMEDDDVSPTVLVRVLDMVLRSAGTADADAHDRAYADLVSEIEALRGEFENLNPPTPDSTLGTDGGLR